MKILIVNQPLGNRGDESAHKAFMRRLLDRFPGCTIEVLLINQKEDDIDIFRVRGVEYTNVIPGKYFYKFFIGTVRRGMPFLAALHPQVRGILRKFRQADRVVCAPGGMNLGGFRDWVHLSTMYLALQNNRNVAYFSRSIGPFDNDRFSAISRKILTSVSFLSLRDKKSYDIAVSLGCNARMTMDSAFLEKPDVPLPTGFVNSEYAVLVPNELIWHQDFKTLTEDAVQDFFISLAESIHKEYPALHIVMLPQLCGRQNDINFLKRISLGKDYVNVCGADTDSDTQQVIIRNAAFLIGCRYHSIVFALNNDTPFAAMDYEHKIGGMLEMSGSSDRAVRFDAGRLNRDTVDSLMAILKSPYSPASGKVSECASKGFEELAEAIS